MQHDAPINGLLRKEHVCERLSTCLRSVDYMIEAGVLPFIKIGRSVRFLSSDIDDFIASRRVGARKIPASVKESKKAKSHPPTK